MDFHDFEYGVESLDEDVSKALQVSETAEAATAAVIEGYVADLTGDDRKMCLRLIIEALGQAA